MMGAIQCSVCGAISDSSLADIRCFQCYEDLRLALVNLVDAAESYSADQSSAKDPRCGNVQPITVAEGLALSKALREAYEVLRREGDRDEQGRGWR